MRWIGFVCLCIGLTAIVGVSLATSDDGGELCLPLGSIVIDPPEDVEQRRASVDFPHSVHFSYSCQSCHHTWTGEEEIKNCTTSACHDQLETPKKAENADAELEPGLQYYKKAYHQLCIGCHKDIKKKNKALEMSQEELDTPLAKTGPTGCVQCHPKDE